MRDGRLKVTPAPRKKNQPLPQENHIVDYSDHRASFRSKAGALGGKDRNPLDGKDRVGWVCSDTILFLARLSLRQVSCLLFPNGDCQALITGARIVFYIYFTFLCIFSIRDDSTKHQKGFKKASKVIGFPSGILAQYPARSFCNLVCYGFKKN